MGNELSRSRGQKAEAEQTSSVPSTLMQEPKPKTTIATPPPPKSDLQTSFHATFLAKLSRPTEMVNELQRPEVIAELMLVSSPFLIAWLLRRRSWANRDFLTTINVSIRVSIAPQRLHIRDTKTRTLLLRHPTRRSRSTAIARAPAASRSGRCTRPQTLARCSPPRASTSSRARRAARRRTRASSCRSPPHRSGSCRTRCSMLSRRASPRPSSRETCSGPR